MKLIAEDEILSIAKDVTLADGTKYRCIDATQIHELPKMEIVRCKDCINRREWFCELDGRYHSPNFFCGFGAHLDKEPRFVRLAKTHPKQYEYCMRGGNGWIILSMILLLLSMMEIGSIGILKKFGLLPKKVLV